MEKRRKNRPTLLVFTLGPARETQRRSFLPRVLQAAEQSLRRACLDLILTLGRTCACRLEVSSPHPLPHLQDDVRVTPQQGRSFGSRFRSALRRAFTNPEAGPVVAVGTDVPGLEAQHIRAALNLLAEDPDRVVLGPCPDGGFYLLAANRPLDHALAATSWCRGNTLATLRQALAREGRPVVLLSPLVDLDGPADLEGWLTQKTAKGLLPQAVLRAVLTLLAAHRRPRTDLDLGYPVSGPRLAATGRAPPHPA